MRPSVLLRYAWAAFASSAPARTRFAAITFGHVVLGLSHEILDQFRPHEHAHVRQYERWGVLFFPLYVGSSAAQVLKGGRPYHDNAFERQARAVAAAAHPPGARRT